MRRNILVICLLILGVMLAGCSSNTPTPVENNKETISDTETQETIGLKDKVVYDVVDAPTLCLMKFTNSSDTPVEVEVNFVFDKDGESCLMLDMENIHDYTGLAKYDFLLLKTVQVLLLIVRLRFI